MEAQVNQVRSQYQYLKSLALSGEPGQAIKVNHNAALELRNATTSTLKQIQQKNLSLEHFQELMFYQDKANQLINTIKQLQQQMATPTRYQGAIALILQQEPFKSSKKINTRQPSKLQKNQPEKLQQMFKNNAINSNVNKRQLSDANIERKNVPTFKSVINSMKHLQSKNTVKKIVKPNKQAVIQKIISANNQIYQKIKKQSKETSQLHEFEKNILKQERNKCIDRIEQLQNQIQCLSRDNYKLKEIQRSKKQQTIQIMPVQKSSIMYAPYSLPMRHNDLNKIRQKNKKQYYTGNYPSDSFKKHQPPSKPYQQFEIPTKCVKQQIFIHPDIYGNNQFIRDDLQIFDGDQSIQKKSYNSKLDPKFINDMKLQDILNAQDISQLRSSNFNTFQVTKTIYSDQSQYLNASKQEVYMDSKTSTRNKIAFFKKSLVIMKDDKFQIAFKRSQIDPTLQHYRFIYYVQNKTDRDQNVIINYEYDPQHFKIKINEKIWFVPAKEQSREVIQIMLLKTDDLNSVADVHFKIGKDKMYNLWLPVAFFTLSTQKVLPQMQRQPGQLTIQPDRQFSSYDRMSSVLPLHNRGYQDNMEIAYIHGKSKFGKFVVRFYWDDKQLTIMGPQHILDLLGFIMHHYK